MQRLGLPGDLIGLPACIFENAVNAARSLTEAVVATVPFQTLYDLFARFGSVAAALFWMLLARPPYLKNTLSMSAAVLPVNGWRI